MWTADCLPGYDGRVKLVKSDPPTAEHKPSCLPASQTGSSEADSPTETARSVGGPESSPDRHDEVRTGRCTCREGCPTQDGYACKCRGGKYSGEGVSKEYRNIGVGNRGALFGTGHMQE